MTGNAFAIAVSSARPGAGRHEPLRAFFAPAATSYARVKPMKWSMRTRSKRSAAQAMREIHHENFCRECASHA